jgi:hypothetical protein
VFLFVIDSPDVVLEKEVIPAVEDNTEDGQFEIIVDGKTVVGKQKHARNKERYGSGRGDMSVFVSMQEVDLAIKRARNRRRRAANNNATSNVSSSSSSSPTVFGEQSSNLRLEQLYNKRNNNNNNNNNNKRQGGNKA